MALSISAVTNPTAQAAMERLGQLDGCQAHSTSYLTRSDEKICWFMVSISTWRRWRVSISAAPRL